MKKSRLLGALLNAIVPGLGYLYLRRRTMFALLLLFSAALGYLYSVQSGVTMDYTDSRLWGAWLIAALAFAIDAWNEGR